MSATWDVVVVGGGNAALCAALAARDAGASVLLLERAPREFRGGNTRHVRNLRDAHREADRFVTGPYLPDEFLRDIESVTGTEGDPELTSQLVLESLDIGKWAWDHGVRWQAPLRGTLHLSRTNRFFLGGGKSLVNAYYHTAAKAGVLVQYGTTVTDIVVEGQRCSGVVASQDGRPSTISARAVVVASGGFEANLDWMKEYWGDAAANFIVRGSKLNDGMVLRRLLDIGATPIGDPTRFHAIAVDARAPKFDAGIISRLDAIPFGIVVDEAGRRFYDEGEDIWPKRYAIWGRLIAKQRGQIAHVIFDAKAVEDFMPPLYPARCGDSLRELAETIEVDATALEATVSEYNAHVLPGAFRPGDLDDCRTDGLTPPKSHWARTVDTPPYYEFPLRPGITFTYHGVKVDKTSRILASGGPLENLFAAGEVMAGNVLTRGYLAGIGMTIGSVYGRIAGREAALCR